MRKRIQYAVLLVLFPASVMYAQGNPVEYMNKLTKPSEKITTYLWEYIKESAHGNDPKKAEAKRRTVIATVQNALKESKKVGPYNGDSKFRDSVVLFLETADRILREDFGALVNMEEVAEQSYDAMEAYMLARDKANDKLDQNSKKLTEAEKEFAEKNNIKLIEKESDISKNLKIASEVSGYHNKVYLIFFKSMKQEAYLIDSLNKEDTGKIEQNRKSLIKYAKEGLDKLDDMDPFKKDSSLKDICEEYLKYTKEEAEKSVTIQTDFLIKKEEFEKIKKAFDQKKKEERTQQDVDLYNEKVKEINEASRKFNEENQKNNARRSFLINTWNRTSSQFMDRHIPH